MKAPVFLLQVHSDPKQFKRLVILLSRIGKCYVHVDKKAAIDDFVILDPRIVFIESRIDVKWAGVSQVIATLNTLRAAVVDCRKDDVSHFVLLSGSCYPIRSLKDFRNFSAELSHTSLIRISHIDPKTPHWRCLRRYWFYEQLPVGGAKYGIKRILRGSIQLLCASLRRTVPRRVKWFGGSNWWGLSWGDAATILNYPSERELLKFLRFSMASDEIYFHTVLGNTAGSGAHEIGPIGHVADAANLHLVDRSLVRWFDESGLKEVLESDSWFVRKVSSSKSTPLCDALDKRSRNGLNEAEVKP